MMSIVPGNAIMVSALIYAMYVMDLPIVKMVPMKLPRIVWVPNAGKIIFVVPTVDVYRSVKNVMAKKIVLMAPMKQSCCALMIRIF